MHQYLQDASDRLVHLVFGGRCLTLLQVTLQTTQHAHNLNQNDSDGGDDI